jgi:hypothetical protein
MEEMRQVVAKVKLPHGGVSRFSVDSSLYWPTVEVLAHPANFCSAFSPAQTSNKMLVTVLVVCNLALSFLTHHAHQ